MKISDILGNERYWETIKQCSLDNRSKKRHEFMCTNEKKIINFDILKEDYAKEMNSGKMPTNLMKSNDGLYIKDSKYFFVEFKNGKLLKPDNKKNKNKINEIRLKMSDSSLILSDITGMSVEEMRNNVTYILVYNGDRNDMTGKGYEVPGKGSAMLGNSLLRLAGNKKYIQFGLENYVGWLFEEVHTVTPKEFETDFSFIGN